MPQLTMLEGFIFGIIGGSIPEIYSLYKLRHTFHENKPGWISSKFYWFITFIMVIFGGGTVCLYLKLGVNINHLIAIHLGISTPIMIGTAMKEQPKID